MRNDFVAEKNPSSLPHLIPFIERNCKIRRISRTTQYGHRSSQSIFQFSAVICCIQCAPIGHDINSQKSHIRVSGRNNLTSSILIIRDPPLVQARAKIPGMLSRFKVKVHRAQSRPSSARNTTYNKCKLETRA